MSLWCTEIKAIDPRTGELKTWAGDEVEGITASDAQKWCDENKGYLKVLGELVAEIPLKDGAADFENMVDYEKIKNN